MATATKRGSAATSPKYAAHAAPKATPLEFRVYQDNGGSYNWEIAAVDGECLVHSAGFASRDDAVRAAREVYEHAHSARFELDAKQQREPAVV